jgi:signal peptidase I
LGVASLNRILVAGLVVIGVVFGIMLVGWIVALKPYTLPSASTEPDLPRGDYVVMLRRMFAGPLRRGDVVVFHLPAAPNVAYIRRLIGMPGDHVQMKGGQVYLNDKPLAETPLGAAQGALPGGPGPVRLLQETTPEGRSYRVQTSPGLEVAGDTGVYVVPPHCYFTLGDNRDNSLDSRFDPGLAPDDARLGGCGWNAALDGQVGDQAGVGFVPNAAVLGVVTWDAVGARHG